MVLITVKELSLYSDRFLSNIQTKIAIDDKTHETS